MPADTWLSDKPDRVKVPYNMSDTEMRDGVREAVYAGRDDVPIFSDPRIVPTFHGVGAGVFATDREDGRSGRCRPAFRPLARRASRPRWAMMMNYHPRRADRREGHRSMFQKYRDRYVGSIAGESLGYFYWNPTRCGKRQPRQRAADAAAVGRGLHAADAAVNADKYRAVYGRDLDRESVRRRDLLPVGRATSPSRRCAAEWGRARSATSRRPRPRRCSAMRWAFMRGAARQHGSLTATYRCCNFGDARTIFSQQRQLPLAAEHPRQLLLASSAARA